LKGKSIHMRRKNSTPVRRVTMCAIALRPYRAAPPPPYLISFDLIFSLLSHRILPRTHRIRERESQGPQRRGTGRRTMERREETVLPGRRRWPRARPVPPTSSRKWLVRVEALPLPTSSRRGPRARRGEGSSMPPSTCVSQACASEREEVAHHGEHPPATMSSRSSRERDMGRLLQAAVDGREPGQRPRARRRWCVAVKAPSPPTSSRRSGECDAGKARLGRRRRARARPSTTSMPASLLCRCTTPNIAGRPRSRRCFSSPPKSRCPAVHL
jgi:hypothetical protein